ncbi:MAG TPA: autotransporter domain-containing protein, partial [Thermomicrobiales bacterium]|nr:autotransporter domain-containing protein [Thermomicrobiales bacterium]
TVSGSFATVNAGAATADIYTTTGGGPFNINALINAPGQFVQFWDGADETGGVSGLAGGTGTWDGARTNWTTNPDGSDPLNPAGATVNDHWREDVGIFAVTGGTVTTAGALNFQGLQFIVDGYTVNGPGTLNMTGDAPGGTPTRSFVNVEGAGNTATINAVISGNAGVGLSKAGAGTLVLSGANTYDGGTTITAGTLRLTGVGTLGATTASTTVDGASAVLDLGGTTQTQATVSLVDGAIQNGTLNAMTSFTQSGGTMAGAANVPTYNLTGGTLSGTVTASTLFDLQSGLVTGHLAGAAPLVKSGPGTVTLEGASSYTGGTSVQAGTLVGNAASIRGDIANDATVVFNQASDAAFAGNIGGTGAMVKGGLGALTLAGTSTLGWQVLAGGLTSAAGRFTGDVAIGSGASFTFDQAADAAYAGTISGDGAFFKIGAARATLTGNSSGFSGATTVAAGTLSVNGTLGGTLAVLSGGRLQGSGTVGPTTIASGGIIAPGNSIGTLKINGDITFQSGSIYEVEINAGLQSDRVDASGVAAIKGGTVDVIKAAGVYTPGSRWTIVSAGGGVTGTFATFTQNMPFVDLLLAYDADHVYIESRRNTAQFCDVARTSNQCATANAVASLGQGNTVYDAVSALPDDQSARAAFDSLSGELHASTKSAFIEDSRFVREAATDRVRAAFEGIAVRSTPVMAYSEKGFAPAPADTERPAVWMRGFGSWGAWQGDGNAAKLDRSIGGVFFGADGLVTENLRLGLLAGFSHSNFDVGARASSGSSENYHLGLYGGSQWGALGLRFGAAYAWHDIETARSVAFSGFADRLSADYLAATAQVFGELGYRFDTPGASFEPFAGLAYVNLHTDGFSEQGGVAALTSASTNTGVTFTTLGLRASTDFIVDGTKATARGMLGWRHAFGDTTPLSNFVFAGGGSAFTIAGVPLGKDAAVIETGFDFAIAANATLGLSYSGQIADGVQDHGFRADLKVNF